MRRTTGQAILEYLLLVLMLAVTMAVIIRNTNFIIYCYWSGLANMVSLPCVDCPPKVIPPEAERCITGQ